MYVILLKKMGERGRCIMFPLFYQNGVYTDTNLKCNPHKREKSIDTLCVNFLQR